MGFWFTFFLWAATFVISDYFRAKLPAQEPSGEGDFQSPTNTEGRKVPQVVGGTVKVKGPNTLWYGDWKAEAVTVETGIIFKRDETVGYTYKVALALGQFVGETAGMTGIYIGDDKVWDYVADNGSVPGTVADIDLPELFGGEKQGGGFQGRVRAFLGTDDQPVSDYLAARIPLQSAWPGFVYVVVTDLTESSGAVIGESNSLRDIRVEWQCFDTSGLGNDLGMTSNKHIIGRDANPIAAAYKVLVDPDFAIVSSDVNVVNFQTAGDTCYTEGIGYSQLIDSELEAYQILAEIEKHIDGYIGPNPTTGLLEVKLARTGYTPASEFQANQTNIKAINNYSKPEWPQTKNKVMVRFVNREKDYKDDHASAQDMAGRIIAGRPQEVTIRFPGLRDAAAANAICTRTSRMYFWPLAKFEMELDRTAYAKRPGDIIMVTHPDAGNAVDLPTRITRIRTGDPVKQTIKADVVQDVFQAETGIQATPPASEHVPPTDAVQAITYIDDWRPDRWFFELHEQDIEARPTFLVARDGVNTGYSLLYQTRATQGSGSYSADTLDPGGIINIFTRRGTLRAIDESPATTLGLTTLKATDNNGTASVANGGGFYVDGDLGSLIGSYNPIVDFNGLALIGDPNTLDAEYVAITNIVADSGGILCTGVYRGLGSTSIKKHDAGEPVWFIDVGPYMLESPRPGDNSYGMRHKVTPYAPSGAGTQTGYSGEYGVTLGAVDKPYAPTGVINDQLGSTWFLEGNLDASLPDNLTTPTAQGFNFQIGNRRFDQTNFVFGANGYDDFGAIYGANEMADYVPSLLWWVYDLDATPSPTHGTDAILSGEVAAADDRFNSKFFTLDDFLGIGPTITSPLNARFEFAWRNDVSPEFGGLSSGVESNYAFVDHIVAFDSYGPETREAMEATLLLLHFNGNDNTQFALDYSLFNHTMLISGDAVIDTDVTADTGMETGTLLYLPSATSSPLPSPETFVEAVDLSPSVFTLDASEGFVIQCRVYFTTAPTGSSGEQPLVTKWRGADNERSFWLGLDDTTLRLKMSVDGTTELIETTGTRSWSASTWYEIAVCVFNVSGTTYVYFFVNGAFDEAETLTAITALHNSAAPVRIGADGDDNTVVGNVNFDEVRIVRNDVYKAPFTKNTTPFKGRELRDVLLIGWEDGNDGDKAYTSEDFNRYTVNFPTSATTEIDDSQSKFGTKSLRCSGVNDDTSFNDTDGVRIAGTESGGAYAENFDFGTRDLTMECFVRLAVTPPSHTGARIALIVKRRRGSSPFQNWLFTLDDTTNPDINFTFRDSDSNDFVIASADQTMAINTWYHVAVCRKDGIMSLFFDGNRIAQNLTDFDGLIMDNHHDSDVCLGRMEDNNTNDHYALNGWLDEIRILNGVAAYDGATYTVPTAPFTREPTAPDTPIPPPAQEADTRAPSNWQPNNL